LALGRTAEELGGTLTARELVDWAAFEQVYGPVLVHERVDIGFARLSFYLVSMFAEKRSRVKFEDFLPDYLRKLNRRARMADDGSQAFATILGWAGADNLNADR
jgi:hypothetical protein